MCDHYHRSCCYCEPCYPRRCVSCIAFCRCEPCSTDSFCCHCCWTTCPCCCRRTCRSHSVGRVPFKQSSDDQEIRLRKVSGYYLKMQNNSISDLYKKTSPTPRSSRSRGRRGERPSKEPTCSSCKSNDRFQSLMETPNFTSRLLAALEECASVEVCDSYEDFVGVPFTYYPKFVLTGYHSSTCRKSAHGEHLDSLKRRLLSLKNVDRCERRDLLNRNLLKDFNNLYATVGGGMVQTAMGSLEPVPTQLPQQQHITAHHAVEEYRAFFGGRPHTRRSQRRSSRPSRSSPQRKRFSARRMRAFTMRPSRLLRSEYELNETGDFRPKHQHQHDFNNNNGYFRSEHQQRDFNNANGPSRSQQQQRDFTDDNEFNRRQHQQHSLGNADRFSDLQQRQRGFSNGIRTSVPISDFVFDYPTRLQLEERARLSAIPTNREDLFGSRILKGRSSGLLGSFQKRHIIDLGRKSQLRSSTA